MFVARITYTPAPGSDTAVESVLFLSECRGSSISGSETTTIVRMYFDTEAARSEAIRLLHRRDELTIESLEEAEVDWLDLYEQSLEPIEIGRRWIVVPRAGLAPATDREILVIPQERAFGTGSHATTALCLQMIEEIDVPDRDCLDVGTGSAILAIALDRLRAARVVAFDLDPEALGPMRGNIAVNQASRTFPFVGELDALSRTARFDIVVMNILPHVIIPMLPPLVARLRSGGAVVLSGVIESEIEAVTNAAAAAGLPLIDQRRDGEWWAGRFGR